MQKLFIFIEILVKNIWCYIITFLTITAVWQVLEIIFAQKINPRPADGVIAVLLSLYITYLRGQIRFLKEREKINEDKLG